jgi:hypothetical protein
MHPGFAERHAFAAAHVAEADIFTPNGRESMAGGAALDCSEFTTSQVPS